MNKEFNIIMYNVKEMAEILEVSERSIMNYIYSGKIKAQKIGGKWKATKENLEAFCKGE